jgi:hypothetical protein
MKTYVKKKKKNLAEFFLERKMFQTEVAEEMRTIYGH